MTRYRIYFMNPWSGHIDRLEHLDAAYDAAAIKAVQSRPRDQPVELWLEHRKLASFIGQGPALQIRGSGSPNIMERAYELARSGVFGEIEPLAVQLKREGYERVDMHLRGFSSLRRDLTRLCRLAWIAAGNQPLPIRRGRRRTDSASAHSGVGKANDGMPEAKPRERP